jgi:hypothetical protein
VTEKGSFCIALVACVKQKNSQPSLAKDLYTSTWFRKARAYVEQQGWGWYILSAQYGLLAPDTLIQPYEQTLNKMSAGDRRQ